MIRYILLCGFMLFCSSVIAQSDFKAVILDSETKEPVIGATAIIEGTDFIAISDENGILTFANIPDGTYTLKLTFIGYEEAEKEITLPVTFDSPIEISLESDSDELEEVIISSTRSTRTIKNMPTRVEFISEEELEEKANMKPGDIRMLLSESTGIQTQQTSATSANSSIRIQGLDGRYTQILKDGFPLYSGASSGLGLLQTPPLDLKQVEIIKGSASTLYGGGAIAGLVNLISKTPDEEKELKFQINGTSALGLDVNGFYSQRLEKIGVTMFASRNSNAPYDPSDIGLTAIPKFERYIINPKLFVYFNEQTKLDIGVNTTFENRIGGDIDYIKGDKNTGGYFERNKTERISTQFSLQHQFNETSKLTLRNSFNNFHRTITMPDYRFDGLQNGSFTELSYIHAGEKSEWIVGANLLTDDFSEKQETDFPLRDYYQITYGAFIQNTVKATDWMDIETGIRGDYVKDYGFAFLPRASALFTINDKLTSRLGGGIGYKAPTIFTEESERIQYKSVLPIDSSLNKLEKSYGANFDINYKTMLWEEVSLSINELFFYTYIDNPLLLLPLQTNYQFVNVDGYLETKGIETNIKIGYEDFKLFLGYTYTDASIRQDNATSQNPLTPKHRLNNVLMYEVEDKWRIGLEAYYFSQQKLNDGLTGQDYWIFGAMAEKLWETFSIYINFENFTDTRQTRFDSIYTGTINNPVFRDIYAPLDGFVVNAGVKIKL